MLIFDQFKRADRALRWLAVGVTAGLGFLLLGAWKIQVLSRREYQQSLEAQSFKTIRVPALRGRILDRTGTVMVENEPRYRLDIFLDELRRDFSAEYTRQKKELLRQRGKPDKDPPRWRQLWDRMWGKSRKVSFTREDVAALQRSARYQVVSNMVAQVGEQIGIPLRVDERALYRHHLERTALPMPILTNLTPVQVARLVEGVATNPAVSLEPQPVRRYPHRTTAAHLLGHLERWDSNEEIDGVSFNYRLPDFEGVMGLEKVFDEPLRGVASVRSVLVNSAGYRQRTIEEDIVSGRPGRDLVLTLDLGLQQVAERALAQASGATRGAVVVMDPRNGDILALVSAPSFDPSYFVGTRDVETWKRYMDEKMRPMFNRAIQEHYAPGSIFKIVTALACFESGALTVDSAKDWFESPGYFQLNRGSRPIRDTADGGRPSRFDFRTAFIKSSNTYFIHHGLKAGKQSLIDMGRRFHLGEPTGLKLGGEAPGEFPDPETAERVWTTGNMQMVCIGQQITVTPIQMAVLISAVANGGRVFYPRVASRLAPAAGESGDSGWTVKDGQLRNELRVRPEHLDLVRSAMRDDVADDAGTGKSARVAGMDVCGKTGTAQITEGNRVVDHIVWFVSFAPYDHPRYSVVVMVESGASGGGTCGPVARKIYEYLRDRDRAVVAGNGGGMDAGTGKGRGR